MRPEQTFFVARADDSASASRVQAIGADGVLTLPHQVEDVLGLDWLSAGVVCLDLPSDDLACNGFASKDMPEALWRKVCDRSTACDANFLCLDFSDITPPFARSTQKLPDHWRALARIHPSDASAHAPALKRLGFSGALLDARSHERPDITAMLAAAAALRAQELDVWVDGAFEEADLPRLAALRLQGVILPDTWMNPQTIARARRIFSTPVCERAASAPLPDRIFVRDFEIEALIGVYQREYDAPQRLRFSVEADVAPRLQAPHDVEDIFSYDIILDAIRVLVSSGHIEWVETMAEELATRILLFPQVLSLRITIEKLDICTGSVGISIARSR